MFDGGKGGQTGFENFSPVFAIFLYRDFIMQFPTAIHCTYNILMKNFMCLYENIQDYLN